MSLPEIRLLKARQSTELKIDSRTPQNFTTAVVNHFCSMEFGGWAVGGKIINNDSVNTIVFRLHSNRGTARIVPVSSELEINEWFDIITITPDGTTGDGQLELDIVAFSEAFKRG